MPGRAEVETTSSLLLAKLANFRLLIMVRGRFFVIWTLQQQQQQSVVVLNEFFGLSLLFALTRSEQQRAEFSSTVYVVGQNFVSDVS